MLEVAQLTHAQKLAEMAGATWGRGLEAHDRADLEQTALTAILEAHVRGTFDAERGIDWGAYMWRVAVLAARRARIKAHSPVHGSANVAAGVGIRAVRAAPIESIGEHSTQLHDRTTPEAQLALARFRSRVRTRLARLIGKRGARFAIALFTGEYHSREFAQAHEVPVVDVYELRATIRQILQRDPVLRDAWKELGDG